MATSSESTLARALPLGGDLPRAVFGVLAACWLCWAVLLALAMALGTGPGGHDAPWAKAARMGSSLVLVAVAWRQVAWWRNSAAGRYALAIASGMTLGAIGDFFNAGLLEFLPLEDPVLGGIVAFALGHVAYITGEWGLGRRAGLTCIKALSAAIASWQLIGLIGWGVVAFAGSEARALVWPALPYSLLLAGTAGIATGLALQDRRLIGLAVGGALFLASDLLLACGLFRGTFAHQTVWVWLTYGPAQMLIVYSVPTAVRILAGTPARH